MPSDQARRERRRKQFGRPLLEPEDSNGVALPASLPSAPPTSSHKDAAPTDITTSGVLLPASPEAIAEDPDQGSPSSTPKKIDKKSRFILFVGNLPYSATTAGVERHFAPVKPVSIRHSTDKATGRSRGFAFLEFEDVKRMESCLGGWHRSIYREETPGLPREGSGDGDGANGANGEAGNQGAKHQYAREGWRRINVQLTAGGGGKSETRQKRLREKNEKLEKERKKRAKKNAEKGKEKGGEKGGKATADAPVREDSPLSEGDMRFEVHPSRRAMLAGRS